MHLWQLDIVGGVFLAVGANTRYSPPSSTTRGSSWRPPCCCCRQVRRCATRSSPRSPDGVHRLRCSPTTENSSPASSPGRYRSRSSSSGSAANTASQPGWPSAAHQRPPARSSGSIARCDVNCSMRQEHSNRLRPPKQRSTNGYTPTTRCDPTNRWAWPPQQACSAASHPTRPVLGCCLRRPRREHLLPNATGGQHSPPADRNGRARATVGCGRHRRPAEDLGRQELCRADGDIVDLPDLHPHRPVVAQRRG